MILFILCLLTSILSSPISIKTHESGVEIAERISNTAINKVAKANHIPMDDSEFVALSQHFRQVCLETIPTYHEIITKNPSQLMPLLDQVRSTLTSKLLQTSLQKRFISTLWSLVKQIVSFTILALIISYTITVPQQKIKAWYCKTHPCESEAYE